MKLVFSSTSILLLILCLFSNACQKIPSPINEEELITTIILSVQKLGSNTIEHYTFEDIDGIGGQAATIDSILLSKNSMYDATITLLNKTIYPIDTISNEVLEEGDVHQFFYASTPISMLKNFVYQTPNDIGGNPIGLNFTFETDDANTIGSLKITLRHQPNKLGNGVSSGDITNANGETDVEVSFPVRLTNV